MTTEEKAKIIAGIHSVFETELEWNEPGLHYPAKEIIKLALSIKGLAKYKDEASFNSNGWQWDWWQCFVYNGKNYVLSGSGYYGGHAFTLE